ncbi:MAG: RNA methyltransferase, partial [Alphaproteobacteria bacterium]|nr:RNA methyltransferase [Alphaproteobacteria bacterium]
ITLEQCVHTQPDPANQQKARLYFSPIKKQRMDILIEKAVELGVTSLHPVLMHRTVLRKINEERIHAQIIEAAEQCKRMDIPELYPVQTFDVLLSNKEITPPLYACIERKSQNETRHLNTYTTGKDTGFLIGPEGGFDDKEVADLLAHKSIIQTSLGETILRAETAAIACLSWAHLTQ